MSTLGDLREGRSVGGDCDSEAIPPKWLVQQKFERGQKLLKDNIFAIMFCHLGGLVMLVNIPSIYYPLEKTGNSSTLVTAFQRYLHTLTHVVSWYSSDIFDTTSEGHKSLKHIRGLHRKTATAMKSHCTVDRAGHVWISQYDMAITQFAFIGMMIVHPDIVGFAHLTSEDRAAICHFWRCIGHLLGISDQYNLFNSDDLQLIEKLCRSIESEVFVPSLTANPQNGLRMGKTIMESATKSIIRLISYNAIMKFWSEVIGVRYFARMSYTDWLYYYLISATFKSRMLGITFIRNSLNERLYYAIRKARKRVTSIYKDLCIRDNQGGVQQIKGCPFAATIG